MKKYIVGVDCGSAAYKGALFSKEMLLETCVVTTGWNPSQTFELVLEKLLDRRGIKREEITIAVTGYGRQGIPFADKSITEITCHALGAEYLLPGVKTVIDIGGQDSKVILLEEGKVKDFQMNDKCAAGTGRFLEMSANRMGIDIEEFPTLLEYGKYCSLTSMCAVFADSEIISLLASGRSREEVAGGIIQAVVTKTVALAGRIEVCPPIMLTGGLARLECIREELTRQLGMPVTVSPLSRFAGAIGAALKLKE